MKSRTGCGEAGAAPTGNFVEEVALPATSRTGRPEARLVHDRYARNQRENPMTFASDLLDAATIITDGT